MNRVTKFYIVLIGFLLLFTKANAQNLPEYSFKILKNDSLEHELFSYFYLQAVYKFPEFTVQNGQLAHPIVGDPVGNLHPLLYVPNDDFTGVENFILQYRGNPGTGYHSWAVKYVNYRVEVLSSVIHANPDDVVTGPEVNEVEIDVLANDSSTHGGLEIKAITNVMGGVATITENNTVVFTLDPFYDGFRYFNYVVEDSVHSTAFGQASIQVVLPENLNTNESIILSTINTRKLNLLLPDDGYIVHIDHQPQYGSIEFISDYQALYIPLVDSAGVDNFVLTDGEFNRTYQIYLYDLPNDGLSVVDDEVYTLKNSAVQFDVLSNDFAESFLFSWTQPARGVVQRLEEEGNGVFAYTPNTNFHGYDEFKYTLQVAPMVFQTATVRIGVDNFNPVNLEEFNFNAETGKAFVLDYNIPVDNYSFEIVEEPLHGTIEFFEGLQNIVIGCDTLSGYNLLVYFPEDGYIGPDEFELDYCPGNSPCRSVKVKMEILDTEYTSDCPCVGKDCIWKGDTNGDGKVDVADLLPIGYYMGYEGSLRNADPDTWVGLNAEDWNMDLHPGKLNIKHVDSDGDGMITAADTTAILENYNAYNNLVHTGVTAFKPFPFYISTSQDTVYAGDYLYLDISIGNTNNPVIDLNGLSYHLQFPPQMLEESSLKHYFLTDSWLSNAASSMQLNLNTIPGRVENAFSRVGPKGATGFGFVAKSEFIVEGTIVGLKAISNVIPIKIILENATGMDGNGNRISLPSAEKTIYLKLKSSDPEPPVTAQLHIYPNPSTDFINIHLNGQHMIGKLNVYNITGILMDQMDLQFSTNKTRLDISNYINGVYIVEVTTPNGKTAQRFEVIK